MSTMKIECTSCGGTGLFRGPHEFNDCAVVCPICGGVGGGDISYEEFKERKPARHIKRVFRYVETAGHSHKDTGGILYSKAGCTYAAWIKGADPLPVRDLYCPLRWDALMRDRADHPAHDQYAQMCIDHTQDGKIAARMCPRHNDPQKLAACWKRFDELTKKGEKR